MLFKKNFKFVLIFLLLPYILWFLELMIGLNSVKSSEYGIPKIFEFNKEQIFYFSILYPIFSLIAMGIIITSSILVGKEETITLFIFGYFPILFLSLIVAVYIVLENFFLISYSIFAPWSLVLALVFPVFQFLNQIFSFAYLPGEIYERSRKWLISIILGIVSFAIIQIIINFMASFYFINTLLRENYEISPSYFGFDLMQVKGSIDYSIILFSEITKINFALGIIIRLLPIFAITIIIFLLSKKLGVGKETTQLR